ncbi:LPXTG cell wall anchor domain-containing protein [Actinoplanes sp. NPDC049118]|uniref:LPXTG cell wall anchor domain-containing protein n=1 Tax=Actinoplanes sp. NPDC049118 TaxID=3155769 RepID=UPI0034072B01
MTGRWRFNLTFALLAAGAALAVPAAPAAAAPVPVDLSAHFAAPAEVTPGELADYVLTTVVPGPPSPTGVRIVLTLPDGLTFEDGGGSGPCTAGSGATVVTCIVDPGGTDGHPGGREWTVRARAAQSLPVGTVLTARAEVLSDGAETNPADNTVTATSRVAGPGASFIKATAPAAPVVPGRPARVTVRVHHGGDQSVDDFAIRASVDGDWYGGGDLVNVPSDCFGDPGSLTCEIKQPVEPGQDLDLEFVLPTKAGDKYWGTRYTIGFQTQSLGGDLRTSTVIVFAGKPSGTPAPTGTSAGEPGTGLPVTGAATASLAAAGALLVAAGAGTVLATRRRRHRRAH